MSELPAVGTKLSDGVLTREVLWADVRRVRVRSTWEARNGISSYELTLRMKEWAAWAAWCECQKEHP